MCLLREVAKPHCEGLSIYCLSTVELVVHVAHWGGFSLALPVKLMNFGMGASSRLVPWVRNRDGVNLDIDGAWRVLIAEVSA